MAGRLVSDVQSVPRMSERSHQGRERDEDRELSAKSDELAAGPRGQAAGPRLLIIGGEVLLIDGEVLLGEVRLDRRRERAD